MLWHIAIPFHSCIFPSSNFAQLTIERVPSNSDSRSLELIRGNKSRWKNVRLTLIQRKNGGSLRDNRGEGRVGWQSVEASKPRLDTGDPWRFTIHEEVTEERRDRYLNERCRPV